MYFLARRRLRSVLIYGTSKVQVSFVAFDQPLSKLIVNTFPHPATTTSYSVSAMFKPV